LLEWDSYSPPFGNAADDDDDDDYDDSSNDYGRRRRGLRRGLSSSSSCGVLSDLNHWMLSPSPRIFYDESPFPYSFTPQCQRGLSNPFDFSHHHIHQNPEPDSMRSRISRDTGKNSHSTTKPPSTPRSPYPPSASLLPHPHGCCLHPSPRSTQTNPPFRPSPSLTRRVAASSVLCPAEAEKSSQSHHRHRRQSQILSSNHPASTLNASCPYCAAAVVVVDVPPSSSSPPPLSALRYRHRRQISSPCGSPQRRLIAERIFSLEDRQPSFLATPVPALPPPPPAPSPPFPPPPLAPPPAPAHSLPLTPTPDTNDNADGSGRKTNRETDCAFVNVVTRAPVTRAPSPSAALVFGHDVKTTRCNTVPPVVYATEAETTRSHTVHPIVQSGGVESDRNHDEKPAEAAAAILDSTEFCGAKNLALGSVAGAVLALPSPPSADSSFGSLEVIHFPYPKKGDEEEQAPLRNRSLSVAAEDDFGEKKRKKSLGNFIVADSTPSRWTFP